MPYSIYAVSKEIAGKNRWITAGKIRLLAPTLPGTFPGCVNFSGEEAVWLSVARLFSEMMKVIKSDFTSPRGERDVAQGAIQLLEGFDFNGGGRLNR